MKIAYIVPGSGDTFYCQNCMRDGELFREFRKHDHDVTVVPMYLPLFAIGEDVTKDIPVFFSAVEMYLKHRYPFLKHMPQWLCRILKTENVLRQAAQREGSVKASGLASMTISMLRGESGGQAEELEHLVEWLSREVKPDIIHLSNALLLGLVRELRKKTGAKIVCSLQDEDGWLDAMARGDADEAWAIFAERAKDVDAFISVSRYYGQRMKERMKLLDEQLHVVPVGLNHSDYQVSPDVVDPPLLGYLSRISESAGFGALADAFIELKRDERLKMLKFKATGGVTAGSREFVRSVQDRFRAAGVEGDVEILEKFDKISRIEFLSQLSVLSVPVPGGEAFGTYLIEAMASGVPVVQPAVGAFPEIVEATGGGITYAPDEEGALVSALKSILLDKSRAVELGRKGRDNVAENFSIEKMAENTIAVYSQLND